MINYEIDETQPITLKIKNKYGEFCEINNVHIWNSSSIPNIKYPNIEGGIPETMSCEVEEYKIKLPKNIHYLKHKKKKIRKKHRNKIIKEYGIDFYLAMFMHLDNKNEAAKILLNNCEITINAMGKSFKKMNDSIVSATYAFEAFNDIINKEI